MGVSSVAALLHWPNVRSTRPFAAAAVLPSMV
jgi:hypothetical protein